LHDGVLFKKGYDGDPLRCLGPKEASEMIKEVHAESVGSTKGRKVVQMPVIDGLLLAYHEEGHNRICEEMSQLPSTSQPDSHSPTELTQYGHPMALPHLGAQFVD